MKALEEDSGCDDGGGGEVHVVGWRYKSRVEEIQCFLWDR